MFNPYDWYWQAEDDRVYSSKAQAIVSDQNADFLAWKGDGARGPTIWPRDAQGNQTDDVLQAVLEPYGLFASLLHYAKNRRWQREIGGITVSGIPVATDDRSKLMISGARTAADADAGFTTPWDAGDVVVELNAAQVIGISDAVAAHVKQCFAIYSSVKEEIEDDTITTREQIDTAFEA